MFGAELCGSIEAAADFEDLLPDVSIKADELRLARTLIEAARRMKSTLSDYKDTYTEKLRELVEAKGLGPGSGGARRRKKTCRWST